MKKNCREISKDKIAVCEKTAGLRSGNYSDLDSACLKALVPVEIFQFSDMHYESRFLHTFQGYSIQPKQQFCSDKQGSWLELKHPIPSNQVGGSW